MVSKLKSITWLKDAAQQIVDFKVNERRMEEGKRHCNREMKRVNRRLKKGHCYQTIRHLHGKGKEKGSTGQYFFSALLKNDGSEEKDRTQNVTYLHCLSVISVT